MKKNQGGFVLTPEAREAIFRYLCGKPFVEVEPLIQALRTAPAVEIVDGVDVAPETPKPPAGFTPEQAAEFVREVKGRPEASGNVLDGTPAKKNGAPLVRSTAGGVGTYFRDLMEQSLEAEKERHAARHAQHDRHIATAFGEEAVKKGGA
jgi:hypothetical protein